MHAEPMTVPDHLVEDLRNWDPDQLPAKALYEPGELVQIKEGPFKNVEGDFLQLLKDSTGESRALLLIDILGKSQQIKVPTSHIQKIS